MIDLSSLIPSNLEAPETMNSYHKAEVLAGVFPTLLLGNKEQALTTLTASWPFPPVKPGVRKIPANVKVQTFVRDKFQCRYYGTRTVHLGALRLLSHLFPQAFPFHPNWRREVTHPAYWEISSSCDHLIPVARGGDNRLENLVTACYRCNAQKGDWLLEEWNMSLRDASTSTWDGLIHPFIQVMTHYSVQEKGLRRYYREAQQAIRILSNP